MSWLKPPPLVPKPMCPAVTAGWGGFSRKFVKKVVLLSVGFWLLVLFLPALVLLVLAWPALKGTLLGAVCAFGVMFVGYVCLLLGLWASQKMVGQGHLKRVLAEKAKGPK